MGNRGIWRTVVLVVGLAVGGCDGGGPSADRAGSWEHDVSSGDDDGGDPGARDPAVADGEAEVLSGEDLAVADLPGDGSDTPVSCGAGEACNDLLDEAGRCPGRCVPVSSSLRCDGVVRLGVCLRHFPPETWDLPPETGESLRLSVVEAPAWVRVGEVFSLRLSVRNPVGVPVRASLSFKHQETVEVLEDPLAGSGEWRLDPGEVRELRFLLRSVGANVFHPESQEYLTLQAGEDALRVPGGIVFGEEADRACGDWRFPGRWDACQDCSTYDRYEMAACCDGVFFPGAQCCRDEDCQGAVCVDGHCVPWAPWSGNANTLPRGPQRVLVVIADDPETLPPTDLCGEPWAEGEDRVQARRVEDWFNDRAEARGGLRPLRLRWWFASVPDSRDFAPGPEDQVWSRWLERLDQWRTDHGCPPLADYDKVIAWSPRLDLQGYGGQAGDRGRIGVAYLGSPYLLVHELAHTFGASDLYLDSGGTTWLRGALMANGWGIADPPEDLVTWAEVGLGDLDRDGVVDLASYLECPDQLSMVVWRASLTAKETLELTLAVGGRQGDRTSRVMVPLLTVELPDHGAVREVRDLRWEKTVAFDGHEVDLDAVRQRGRVTVRVRVDLPVTTADFRREVRVLDLTRVLRVSDRAF